MPDADLEERILDGLFLVSTEPNPVLETFNHTLNNKASESLQQKIDYLTTSDTRFHLSDVFPWISSCSEGIEANTFLKSFFIQPDIFLRVRPGYENSVTDKLNKAGVIFERPAADCISCPPTTAINKIIFLDKEAVIQDMQSQATGNLLNDAFANDKIFDCWDCCAASGGKSLMVHDRFPAVKLTVSDSRSSILHNLETRFERAGIADYKAFVADLTKPIVLDQKFELVIADCPCTGSGTWSRTPEQLFYFDETRIDYYAELQKQILKTVMKGVGNNGYLLYITCSVFKQENEDAVAFVLGGNEFELLQASILNGASQKSDTMYAALFRKL